MTKSKVEKSASMRQLSKTRFDASQLRLQSNLLQSVTPEKLASQQPVSLEVDPQSQIRLVGDPKPGSNKMPTVADFFSDSQNQRGLVQGDTRFELNQKLKSERDLRISLEKEPSKLKDELTVTKKRPRDSPGGPNPRFPDTSEMSQNDPKILRDFERLPSLQAFRSQLTIATPGGVKASHKPKPMLAVPGDVSSFSVTPFLKRATMEFNDSDMSSSETQTSVHSKDHVLPTDACSSTLVPALTVPKIDKAFNHRGQDNWSNHPATNRHCRTGSRIHASAKTSKESVFKKQRELISKRERGGFDSGEDADNHVRAAKNESSDGLWTRTDSLSFSPLKRRIRVL